MNIHQPLKLLVLAFGLLLVSTGCMNVFNAVQGSGNVITEKREVPSFKEVAIHGSGHVTIVQGGEESLSITADDNFLPLITSEVTNGALRAGPNNVSLRPTQKIQYAITVTNLNSLRLSGSLSAEIDGLKTEKLDAQISGSGSIKIANLEANSLSVGISGSGSAELSGAAEDIDLSVSGSGEFKAGTLQAKTAEVGISGAGDAVVWAADSLKVRVSGSGSVSYYGSPAVEQSISGSGKVRSLGSKEER